MDVVAAVFARAGSKGVLRKNLRQVGGCSLVELAIRHAQGCSGVERVVVSTDDEEIAEVALRAGAEVPWLRPAVLADDLAREWDAWRHLVSWMSEQGPLPSVLLVAPCTAPLRLPSDLDRCVEACMEPGVDVAITVTESSRSPWFNMVTLDPSGNASLVIEPRHPISRRQDTPKTFDVGTVGFAVRPSFVMSNDGIYDGTVRAVAVPKERSLDVDDELDLVIAEALLARRETGPLSR